MNGTRLSVVIPTYNEKGNIDALIERLFLAILRDESIVSHELLFIDDYSSDGTFERIAEKSREYPFIRAYRKIGKKGKASSILEGIALAQYDTVAMIDADLQYPPEAIPSMAEMISSGADIIVADRVTSHTRPHRRALSRLFKFIFGRWLFGVRADVQSGLKVFRKAVFYNLPLRPTEWGFDYDFLFKAKRMGWKIDSYKIDFSERTEGESKVRVFRTGFELFFGAMKLRTAYFFRTILKFLDHPHRSEARPFDVGNTEDYLFLPAIHSAKKHFFVETISFFLFAAAVSGLFYWFVLKGFGFALQVVLSALIAFFYFAFMIFKMRVIFLALSESPAASYSDEEIASLRDEDLPVYTILIPLYREALVARQIIDAMTAIDYPTDKLDVMITLEEYDTETLEALYAAGLPEYFRIVTLPDVRPKTKPKALNVAFLQARGEYLVIYDAEIIPDRDQLKKAVLAFRDHPEIAAYQTRLDHYNPRQNILTRFFNSEFSFHYDYFLPGLQKMNIPLPLSGHSTHMRTSAVAEIGAWDPYNVTEDCDLGIRLYRYGFRAGMLDSGSREEAVDAMWPWVLQRTRWMKGFIQTSIVHLRHPLRFKDEIGGWKAFVGFLFIVPGGVVVNILNFLSWGVLLSWMFIEPDFVREIYPSPILYLSVFSFLLGTFVFTFLNLYAAYSRGRYDLVKYNLLSFAYWMLLSFATVRALYEFVVRPYHWAKTDHGAVASAKEKDDPIFRTNEEGIFARIAGKTTIF